MQECLWEGDDLVISAGIKYLEAFINTNMLDCLVTFGAKSAQLCSSVGAFDILLAFLL